MNHISCSVQLHVDDAIIRHGHDGEERSYMTRFVPMLYENLTRVAVPRTHSALLVPPTCKGFFPQLFTRQNFDLLRKRFHRNVHP